MVAQSELYTPPHLFYIRNHFSYPVIDVAAWRLAIEGLVTNPIQLSYSEILKLPKITLPVTLECAGNKRALYDQKSQGEQWELGAISHALWSGVSLGEVLRQAGIQKEAVEVVFEGMDKGERKDLPGQVPFSRSLPLAKALHPDTLLAYEMNGDPLPDKHGFPLRLIVPGWYGIASVKWLHRIRVLDKAFDGPFQTIDYVILDKPNDFQNAKPVTEVKVNSSIAYPADQQEIALGVNKIHGVAWAGPNSVIRVEISTDGGKNWSPVGFEDSYVNYSWRRWSYDWNPEQPGAYTIKVKATNDKNEVQPDKAAWNVKGYANNSIHSINVHVIQKDPNLLNKGTESTVTTH